MRIAKLWLVLSVVLISGGEVMAGRGRSWVVVEKLRLPAVGCGWLWVVAAKLWLVVDGRGGHSLLLIFIVKMKVITAFVTLYVPGEGELLCSKENGYREVDW